MSWQCYFPDSAFDWVLISNLCFWLNRSSVFWEAPFHDLYCSGTFSLFLPSHRNVRPFNHLCLRWPTTSRLPGHFAELFFYQQSQASWEKPFSIRYEAVSILQVRKFWWFDTSSREFESFYSLTYRLLKELRDWFIGGKYQLSVSPSGTWHCQILLIIFQLLPRLRLNPWDTRHVIPD